MEITVSKKAEKKLKKGYPLIQQEDLVTVPTEFPNEWVRFIDNNGKYIATGYLAKQNKGIGWLVNWQGEVTQTFIEQLFVKARARRRIYEESKATTAYRLFNGEGDGLGGLTVDRYNDYLLFSWYNQTLYARKQEIVQAFVRTMPEIVGAYEKVRFSNGTEKESQFLYGEEAPEPLIIKENGVFFAAYLNEGLMTGLFLDQKEVRERLIDGLACQKNVLNMFSYTGAFSVAAAMGGAKHTTSVDLAKRSVAKTNEQFELNHLNISEQTIFVMDVFDFFRYAKRKKFCYDVIILDPPSFARNKKKTFSVTKHYGELVKDAVDLLEKQGVLIASTNAANLSLAKYKKMLTDALDEKRVSYCFKEFFHLPKDFHVNAHFDEGNYLKVFFIEIKK